MYRLPPEWAPQAAVLLTWPHTASDWQDLPSTQRCFAALAAALLQRAHLLVLCHDAQVQADAKQAITDALEQHQAAHSPVAYQVLWVQIPNNDCWARDHGPITVFDASNQPLWLDFQFTGWGHKYPSDLDDAIVAQLSQSPLAVPRLAVPLALEGGAIDTDGAGSLLVSARCVLHENRNNGLQRADFERIFETYFGCTQVLWLDHGYLQGDDTDAHIDTLARFTPRRGIVYVACDDPSDAHYAELLAMQQQLRLMSDQHGQPYQLHALPWPPAIFSSSGQRLPASYANFLILNGAVFVPVYGVSTDSAALAVIQNAFPDYDVQAIDCRALIEQFGSLHCVTMQLPADVMKGI